MSPKLAAVTVIGRHLVPMIFGSACAGGSRGQVRAPRSQPGRRAVPTGHPCHRPGRGNPGPATRAFRSSPTPSYVLTSVVPARIPVAAGPSPPGRGCGEHQVARQCEAHRGDPGHQLGNGEDHVPGSAVQSGLVNHRDPVTTFHRPGVRFSALTRGGASPCQHRHRRRLPGRSTGLHSRPACQR